MYANVLNLSNPQLKIFLNSLPSKSIILLIDYLKYELDLYEKNLELGFVTDTRKEEITLKREYRTLESKPVEDRTTEEQDRFEELSKKRKFTGVLSNNYRIENQEVISYLRYNLTRIPQLISLMEDSIKDTRDTLLGIPRDLVKTNIRRLVDSAYVLLLTSPKEFKETFVTSTKPVEYSVGVLDASLISSMTHRNGIPMTAEDKSNLTTLMASIELPNDKTLHSIINNLIKTTIDLDSKFYQVEDIETIASYIPTINYVQLESFLTLLIELYTFKPQEVNNLVPPEVSAVLYRKGVRL